MEIINDPHRSDSGRGPHAVSIGVYDGVHIGHRAVITQTKALGEELGIKMAVVTFDPHPALIVRPENAPRILTDLEQKLELLADCGVDTTFVVPFDTAQASETAPDFVTRVLVGCLNAQAVVVGHDFHFGKARAGNVDVLTSLGDEHGFSVNGIELLERSDGLAEPVSSTAVRNALAGGAVRTAASLLGRFHEVRGTVVHGDQRGRQIGFPTANVDAPPEIALPADAVYAAWYVTPDGERHRAAVNVGKRPTFYQDAERSMLEAHLIDYEGDLYGQQAKVQFVELLRSEQRFDGIEAIRAQLADDVEAAKAQLS
jgi:riboflavin kinase/FMN adenylyltransferase